jgi:hypothetical protein
VALLPDLSPAMIHLLSKKAKGACLSDSASF